MGASHAHALAVCEMSSAGSCSLTRCTVCTACLPVPCKQDFIFQLDENFPSDVASAYNLSHYHAGQPGAAYGGRGALVHREAEVVCSHSLGVR